ncbi:TPM domain-containing protein [Carboxylicivirga taeanensis]|uniref:TPM domain-containing protein n=1 Tax=Carboxylicivirga taeanensis TaxID=1416875 RepID=UPI003F6E0A7F
MKNKLFQSVFTLSIAILFSFQSCGQQKTSNKQKVWVYDYENVLTAEQEQQLNLLIQKFEQETTNEIAIVTVENIGRFDKMVEYAVDFGNQHGIGKKDKDNGLIILFSKNMRGTFLATGYGTEKILKDEICSAIIESSMVPYFKNQEYYEGIKAGLEECIKKWQ